MKIQSFEILGTCEYFSIYFTIVTSIEGFDNLSNIEQEITTFLVIFFLFFHVPTILKLALKKWNNVLAIKITTNG